MNKLISRGISDAIVAKIAEARGNGTVVEVYQVAEAIRLAHQSDNVALEDIVEALVVHAGSKVALVFNTGHIVVLEKMDVPSLHDQNSDCADQMNGNRCAMAL